MSASVVLASRTTLNVPQAYASLIRVAAALLDGQFEHPDDYGQAIP